MKELRTKKKWVTEFESAVALMEEAEILAEFIDEGEATEEQLENTLEKAQAVIEALEFRNMLNSEGDD